MLAELLDQLPFNLAIADLYKTRFNGVPGRRLRRRRAPRLQRRRAPSATQGLKAQAVSGETPKRELAEILAAYERGEIDVLVNAQLLAEGWNSPRATVCMHLAPTASKRIYQQRVGRVTRRHPGKEAGIVVDFVHPATKHDDPVVTLHSLLDRDVYRGGAIVVGPVRRGRGRRVRVERRVLPVTRRSGPARRGLRARAVADRRRAPRLRRAARLGRARRRPRRAQRLAPREGDAALRPPGRAQAPLPAHRRAAQPQHPAAPARAAGDRRAARRRGLRRGDRHRRHVVARRAPRGRQGLLQALAEKRIGRRDQANAWIWRLAEYTREVHEEYAVQRWPETKRLLGLLVNSSGGAHARNARRLVHASRKQDRRLSAALLAAALAHTPEAEEVLRGARTRMARKPTALARELLRNFPKGRRRGRGSRRRKRGGGQNGGGAKGGAGDRGQPGRRAGAEGAEVAEANGGGADDALGTTPRRRRTRRPGHGVRASPSTRARPRWPPRRRPSPASRATPGATAPIHSPTSPPDGDVPIRQAAVTAVAVAARRSPRRPMRTRATRRPPPSRRPTPPTSDRERCRGGPRRPPASCVRRRPARRAAAVVVDPGADALAATPAHGPVEQRVARAEGVEDLAVAGVQPPLERGEQRGEHRLDAAGSRPSVAAVSRSSGGSSASRPPR